MPEKNLQEIGALTRTSYTDLIGWGGHMRLKRLIRVDTIEDRDFAVFLGQKCSMFAFSCNIRPKKFLFSLLRSSYSFPLPRSQSSTLTSSNFGYARRVIASELASRSLARTFNFQFEKRALLTALPDTRISAAPAVG